MATEDKEMVHVLNGVCEQPCKDFFVLPGFERGTWDPTLEVWVEDHFARPLQSHTFANANVPPEGGDLHQPRCYYIRTPPPLLLTLAAELLAPP